MSVGFGDVGYVQFRGPVFDNVEWQHAIDHFEHDVSMDIADEGVRMVRVNLSQVLRHPTGYYESRIRATEEPFNTASVNDAGVIYGFWLEGIGSRNSPVTIFPGYHTFARTAPELQERVSDVSAPALARFLAEVNVI